MAEQKGSEDMEVAVGEEPPPSVPQGQPDDPLNYFGQDVDALQEGRFDLFSVKMENEPLINKQEHVGQALVNMNALVHKLVGDPPSLTKQQDALSSILTKVDARNRFDPRFPRWTGSDPGQRRKPQENIPRWHARPQHPGVGRCHLRQRPASLFALPRRYPASRTFAVPFRLRVGTGRSSRTRKMGRRPRNLHFPRARPESPRTSRIHRQSRSADGRSWCTGLQRRSIGPCRQETGGPLAKFFKFFKKRRALPLGSRARPRSYTVQAARQATGAAAAPLAAGAPEAATTAPTPGKDPPARLPPGSKWPPRPSRRAKDHWQAGPPAPSRT
jgi:hypothetical protein